jgi:hypothetical protein
VHPDRHGAGGGAVGIDGVRKPLRRRIVVDLDAARDQGDRNGM